MSYILDALKKAGQQRPPGPVPDLFTAQGPQPSTPRRPAAALVGALVFGCLAIVGVGAWWWGRDSRDSPRPEPLPAASPEAVRNDRGAPPAPAAEAPVPQRSAPEAAMRARPARQSPAPRAAAKASPPVPVAAPPPGAAPPSPPVVAVPEPAAQPNPVPVPAAVTPAPAPAPVVAQPALPDAAAPAAVSAAAAPAPEEVPPPDGRVVELAELPAAVRSAVPALAISGHVWSDEAALRLLTVQDRIVREGGEAAPGVLLEAITPNGAVFVHRGWRFRVPGY